MLSRLGSSIVVKRLLIVALLGSVFSVSAFVVMYFSLRGRTVDVPSVVGKTEGDARESLDDYGLKMVIKSRIYSESMAPNLVTDQYPPPGTTVKTGQMVRVSLSLGPTQATK